LYEVETQITIANELNFINDTFNIEQLVQHLYAKQHNLISALNT